MSCFLDVPNDAHQIRFQLCRRLVWIPRVDHPESADLGDETFILVMGFQDAVVCDGLGVQTIASVT